MTLAAKVWTHQLSPLAGLCATGFKRVGAESPRLEMVKIDFGAARSETNAKMILCGVPL